MSHPRGHSMSEHQISVHELCEYWKHIDNLKEGEFGRYVHTSDMPPWDELCSSLDWRLFKADGGHFSRKLHGFCGVYRLLGLNTGGVLDTATIDRLGGQDRTGTLYIG